MGVGEVALNAFNTYNRVNNTIQNFQKAKYVKDTVVAKSHQNNPYDIKLNNPGIIPKKRTWEMPKYAGQEENSMDKTNRRRKLTKKQKAGIAIGTTVGAIVLADILSKGDVFAPAYSMWEGAKTVPPAMFNKAKKGDFGFGASVMASGLDRAVNKTKSSAGYGWGNNNSQKNNSKKWSNNGSGGSQNNAGSGSVLKNFGAGFTMGAGILAAHMLGDKFLKDKRVKKSYDSKALTNKDIKNYHKTGYYPTKPIIDGAKSFGNSIKSDIADIKAESQKSDKNE